MSVGDQEITMSETELKTPFKADESSRSSPESSPTDKELDEKNKINDTDEKPFFGPANSSGSSRESSLDSDPSDIFQDVLDEIKKRCPPWPSADDLPLQMRTHDTGQIVSVVNQLLAVTRNHSDQLQEIATLTQETRDMQQTFLTQVAENNHQMRDYFQRLESALHDTSDHEHKDVNVMDTLGALEKKLEMPSALQRQLDYIEKRVEIMTEEVKTLGISFEEIKVSLAENSAVEKQGTEKYLDEQKEKSKPDQLMGVKAVSEALTGQLEDMLGPALKSLTDQKELLNATVRDIDDLKTYFQRDVVDGLPEKLAALLDEVKDTLGKQVSERIHYSLRDSGTLTQPTVQNAAIHIYQQLLESNGQNEDCVDNKKYLSPGRYGRRRSCF